MVVNPLATQSQDFSLPLLDPSQYLPGSSPASCMACSAPVIISSFWTYAPSNPSGPSDVIASCMTFLRGSPNQPPEPQNTTCSSLPPAPFTPTLSRRLPISLPAFLYP